MYERKKILLFPSNVYPCKTGGMEIYNYHLIKELLNSNMGDDIFVVTACEQIGIDSSKKLIPKNGFFNIKRYGLGSLSTVFSFFFNKKIKWRNVKTIYLSYTSNFGYNAIAFILLKKIWQVNYVIHIHGGGLGPWKPKWLLKLFFSNAEKIAGVSIPIVKEYSTRSNRDVKYIPPLIPFQKSKYSKVDLKKKKGLEDFDLIILFVGTLKPLKGPETILSAFNQLGSNFLSQNKLGLLMVGGGPMEKKLQKQYESNPNIIFAGKVPNENINEYYAMADIFVIPSWFEGTPISLLEAFFNGLLCLGSNVTGIKEIIIDGENGFLFEKENEIELSSKLKKIISGKIRIQGIISNGSIFFKGKFGYEKHLNDISDFLN